MKSKVANFWCIVGISILCTMYLYLVVRGAFLRLDGFGGESSMPSASTTQMISLLILPAFFLYVCGVAFFMRKGVACKMLLFPGIGAMVFQFLVYFGVATSGSAFGWGIILLMPVFGVVSIGLFIFGAIRDSKERKRDYY